MKRLAACFGARPSCRPVMDYFHLLDFHLFGARHMGLALINSKWQGFRHGWVFLFFSFFLTSSSVFQRTEWLPHTLRVAFIITSVPFTERDTGHCRFGIFFFETNNKTEIGDILCASRKCSPPHSSSCCSAGRTPKKAEEESYTIIVSFFLLNKNLSYRSIAIKWGIPSISPLIRSWITSTFIEKKILLVWGVFLKLLTKERGKKRNKRWFKKSKQIELSRAS